MEKVINFYGKKAQCNQAMEECAELIVAINKCLRYPHDDQRINNLIEEIADVIIMICQLKVIFQIPNSEVESMIKFKEDRIIKRFEQEKKKERNRNNMGAKEMAFILFLMMLILFILSLIIGIRILKKMWR